MNFCLSSAWLWQSYQSFGSFGLCSNLSFANKSLIVCSPIEGFRWWPVWSSGCCRGFWRGFCKQYRLSCRLWSFTFAVLRGLKVWSWSCWRSWVLSRCRRGKRHGVFVGFWWRLGTLYKICGQLYLIYHIHGRAHPGDSKTYLESYYLLYY